MEWRLSDNALETFARCITCLARIGNELAIQASSSQAVCSVLRTPIANINHLTVRLPGLDAPKVLWILNCYSGLRKTYWITCKVAIIATEPTSLPLDAANEIGGKAVELRNYIDATKDNDISLHTLLRIDPKEEFLQHVHSGGPIDVAFSVKELKHHPSNWLDAEEADDDDNDEDENEQYIQPIPPYYEAQ